MYGLTSSPAHPSSEAETAPALLARFDALFAGVADADELVRAAARVAGCTAGMADRGRVLRRCPAGGVPEAAGEVVPSTRRLITVGGRAAGEVWVERPGEPLPFDALLTERMALAAAILVARGAGVPAGGPGGHIGSAGGHAGSAGGHAGSAGGVASFARPRRPRDAGRGPCEHPVWAPAGLGDPALVQAALSPSMPETQRSRALHLLGLPPAGPMRAVAVVVAEPQSLQGALRACAAELSAPPSARTGTVAPHGVLWPRVGALVLPGPGPGPAAAVRPGPGVAVGLGPAVAPERLPESWAQARRAARFAGLGPTWPRLVDAAGLGAQVLLADIPEEAALAHPDVSAVARLEAEPDGPQMLATLEAVCRTRSLREAAKLLSLHHSSVAHRVARAERALAMSLSDPSDRQRVHTAVLLWRLNAPDNWRN
ncbi:helix-turn-helix domain-containing protein [Streptomyces sp. NPDC014870]|uniref:helix-turn-helix domain-containing protein n=1 Tax=Streptomyces sp. NPDC014870 TaxID=3364925 RepID=UPI0036F8D9E5